MNHMSYTAYLLILIISGACLLAVDIYILITNWFSRELK
jgi:hypothetical protein